MQGVPALGGPLAEVLLAHGTQVLPAEVAEGAAGVGQAVQVLGPQQPLLHVGRAPVDGVCRTEPYVRGGTKYRYGDLSSPFFVRYENRYIYVFLFFIYVFFFFFFYLFYYLHFMLYS